MTNFDQLRDKILPVLEPYGVQRIALFGSVVRGEETPESDIDILVDFGARHKVPIGLFKWVELEQELSKRLGRKADLVSARGLNRHIRPYVEEEMVVLYEKTRRRRLPQGHPRRDQAHRVLHARHQ